MAKKQKNYHVGGQQMPLLTPDSDWVAPTELPDLRRVGVMALDRETRDGGLSRDVGPGWAFGDGHVCGVSAAWRIGDTIKSFYAPIEHPDTEGCFNREQISQWERDHQKAGVRFVMQNAPYDVGWGVRDLGVPCPELVDDTTCMAYVIDESRHDYDLDSLCEWRGLPGKDERLLKEALEAYGFPTTPKESKKHLHRLPARFVGPYAEIDAVRTLQLKESLDPEIDSQTVRDAYQLEMDLLPIVHAMRQRGIRIDTDAAVEAQKYLYEASAKHFQELSEKCGMTAGIDEVRSNEWMERVFTHFKVRFPREGFSGRGSFDARWMKNDEHWLPQLCVKAKSRHEMAEKFIGNYILGFAHFDAATGDSRLHASINQFRSESGGTKTYRFSYSEPPLQQMPHRDEELSNLIRGIFLPEKGDYWLSADYSQQEYRLIVHFAERRGLRKAKEAADRYRNDPRTDYHSMVAEMTGLERKPAKDTNFAKSYGAGVRKFASMINKPEAEAEAIMRQYDEQMPFVKQLNELCQNLAQQRGFIRLLDGARIHFDKWEPTWLDKSERSRGWGSGGEIKMAPCGRDEAQERIQDKEHPWYGKRLRRADCRKAMNALIQGSAARQTKMAMRACGRAGNMPMLQMHDELDFSVSEERQGAEITRTMREIVSLNVPMLVDAEYGSTWGNAKLDWKACCAKYPRQQLRRPVRKSAGGGKRVPKAR